jgi:hypothetical protein
MRNPTPVAYREVELLLVNGPQEIVPSTRY